MKEIKTSLDDEYMRERIKIESLMGSVASKEDMVMELEKCLSYLQTRLHDVTRVLTESENKVQVMENESQISTVALNRKIDFLDLCLLQEKTELQKERDRSHLLNQEMDILRNDTTEVR
jgi:hypothetical protein